MAAVMTRPEAERLAIDKLREVERILYEDTNAADHACCGWGPLWHEIKDVLAQLDAIPAEDFELQEEKL